MAFGKYGSGYLNIVFLFTIWSATIRHSSQDRFVISMRGIFKNTSETFTLICAFEYLLLCSCMVISVIILGHPEQWVVWNKLPKASSTENKPKNIQWRCEGKKKAQMTSVWAKNWVPQAMGQRGMSVQRPSMWTGPGCLWSQGSLCEILPVSQCLWRS